MKGRLLKLLKNPLEYVEEERFPDNSWLISLCGYFFISTALTFNVNTYELSHETWLVIAAATRSQSLNETFKNIFIVGVVWIWFSSKMVSKSVQLLKTVKAVGCSFFFPGALALFVVPFQVLYIQSDLSERLTLPFNLWLTLIPGVLSVIQFSRCIHLLNQRRLLKTSFVLFWIIFLNIIAIPLGRL